MVWVSEISNLQFYLGKQTSAQSRRRPRRDTKAKKDKAKEKKKKKKEKQQKAERKRLLKSLGLSALPSSDVEDKLHCMKWKIWDGLESCIKKILQRNAGVKD